MSTLKVNNLEDLGADPVAVNGVLVKSAFPAGTILQVVSTTKTNRFTMSGGTFVSVTGLTATITPSSATSKILVTVHLGQVDCSASAVLLFRLLRGATAIGLGDAEGSRNRVTMSRIPQTSPRTETMSMVFSDSPATTTSLTYGVDCRTASGTLVINGEGDNFDASDRGRGISTITLMEVAG
jgi:hypothetical protein